MPPGGHEITHTGKVVVCVKLHVVVFRFELVSVWPFLCFVGDERLRQPLAGMRGRVTELVSLVWRHGACVRVYERGFLTRAHLLFILLFEVM